jgi:hypothetical protein
MEKYTTKREKAKRKRIWVSPSPVLPLTLSEKVYVFFISQKRFLETSLVYWVYFLDEKEDGTWILFYTCRDWKKYTEAGETGPTPSGGWT